MDEYKKKSWQHIHQDLNSALKTWEELTEKNQNKLSPDEEQLLKIKSILKNLTLQMHNFECQIVPNLSETEKEPAICEVLIESVRTPFLQGE